MNAGVSVGGAAGWGALGLILLVLGAVLIRWPTAKV
jgi:hypothetical protein